ncbi:hypothetical protein LUZ63_022868 [Rhynchospora breviuscula]|uniref:Uncharacterized protein n=1 Tax=Rhynchospora breviuscula TaxID=2022672 RepID=A0A9Q0BXB5_9POAL|nr:hypothetical protein LUZ63_022868 [Rhynchospora breviuscula]
MVAQRTADGRYHSCRGTAVRRHAIFRGTLGPRDAGRAAEIRVWQEDRNPLAVVAGFLRDRKLAGRPVGIEETARFFAFDGLQQALPGVRLVSANPVVRGCRMVKTAPEIALMQLATDVTMAAYRWVYPRVEVGMTGAEVGALMTAATRKLGGRPEFSMALIGEASAYPHGSKQVHRVADGQVVLMDCGCTVEGYQSDVSRSWVHGAPSAEQRKVWDTVAKGQQGYGPGYRLPGLSHRTGHGIGMDGHEPVNLVRGEATPLATGMCFSDEPGLYLPGKFGIRIEDCFHMTEAGPVWFSTPPRRIEAPIG